MMSSERFLENLGGSRLPRSIASHLPSTTKGRLLALMRGLGFERPDYSSLAPEFLEFYRQCAPFTATSIERMSAIHDAIGYVRRAQIDGDFVECGVWRGGSSMLASFCAQQAGLEDMRFWLYDTFAGMAKPTVEDGPTALRNWSRNRRPTHNEWCYAPLDEVRRNMQSTGLSVRWLELVQGEVETTIPDCVPEKIAVLRLDTDWYVSTKHELQHLYPLLEPGGVLIIDDFGDWDGARRAVEEYMTENDIVVLLARVDNTGRLAVKR